MKRRDKTRTATRKYIPPADSVPLGPLAIGARFCGSVVHATGTRLTAVAFDFASGAFETRAIYLAARGEGGG